jgi:hypothetical protein
MEFHELAASFDQEHIAIHSALWMVKDSYSRGSRLLCHTHSLIDTPLLCLFVFRGWVAICLYLQLFDHQSHHNQSWFSLSAASTWTGPSRFLDRIPRAILSKMLAHPQDIELIPFSDESRFLLGDDK